MHITPFKKKKKKGSLMIFIFNSIFFSTYCSPASRSLETEK
jgi:hypothetical protein